MLQSGRHNRIGRFGRYRFRGFEQINAAPHSDRYNPPATVCITVLLHHRRQVATEARVGAFGRIRATEETTSRVGHRANVQLHRRRCTRHMHGGNGNFLRWRREPHNPGTRWEVGSRIQSSVRGGGSIARKPPGVEASTPRTTPRYNQSSWRGICTSAHHTG